MDSCRDENPVSETHHGGWHFKSALQIRWVAIFICVLQKDKTIMVEKHKNGEQSNNKQANQAGSEKSYAQPEQLVELVSHGLKNSPRHLSHWLNLVEAYFDAASDMAKDELALIEAYLKQDLQEIKKHREDAKAAQTENLVETEAFRDVIIELMWQKLSEITDKTQLEWGEVTEDVKHKGRYHAGEEVGIGVFVCVNCGFEIEVYHPKSLIPCPECQHVEFSRRALPA